MSINNSGVLISVVTATWNCEETIRDCLESVSLQDYKNVEHVVVDGASVDGTLSILRENKGRIGVLISEPDRGIYDALNKGIFRSTGDVVGFLHADDIYSSPDVLTRVANAFSDPAVCAVYGDLLYVRRDDINQVVRRWVSSPFTLKRLKWGWMPAHPTLYVRREWYSRIGGFDPRYRISADYFSILSLFCLPGFKAVYLPKVFVKMRLGGASNKSIRNIIRKTREDWDALRRSGVGGVGALAWKNLSKIGQFLR